MVVGGGAVGLYFSRLAAESGLDVTLYESKRDVSEGAEKASGILSIRGLERIGIEADGCKVNTLKGAVLHSDGRSLNIVSRRPMAYVLDRGLLAKSLERDALESGVKITKGKRLEKSDIIDISKDRSTVVVGADGSISGVASAFGFPPIRKYVLTYKAEYRGAHAGRTDVVGLYFSKHYAKGLFGWHVPYSDDVVEIGLGISSDSKMSSRIAFDRFIKSGDINGIIDEASMISGHASMIPLESRRCTVKGNVALIGDAAGQVKATTGGGIIFGCLSAIALRDSIVKSNGELSRLARYERAWRSVCGRDLAMHNMIHNYYSSNSLGRAFRVIKALGMEDFFSKYGDMDSPSLMLKRFLLRGLSE